jgi:hypothetical protein
VLKRSLAAVLSIVLVSACQDEGPPPEPASVEAVSATLLPSAVVGSTVTTLPTFRVLSATGKTIKGVPVTVTVISGGGTIASPATKTRSGATSAGRWTLGPTAGPQTISVRVSPFSPIIYTVNATAGAATAMQKLAGDNSRGPALFSLPAEISVKVVDAFGNGVPATTVSWSVQAGGGSLAASTSVTDSVGVAIAPEWTLGAQSSGEQRLRASAGTFTQEFNATLQSAAASITLENAAPSAHAAGTTIPSAPTFAVRDVDGNILNSIPFTVSVTEGGGTVTSTPARTLVGPTPIGSWKLGNPLGTQTVSVTVDGIPSLFISTTSIIGPAAKIAVIEGAGQRALAGTALSTPPRVQVRDVADHSIANANVTWEVILGGGALAGLTTITNSEGIATMPTWTIGKLGGAQSVRASVGPVSQTIGAETQSDFNLQVRWNGTPPGGAVEAAFATAVNRIRAIIVGDVAPITLTGFTTTCVPGITLTETIQGLVIYATVEFIDGPGGVLGSAGPCSIRNSDQLSWLGRMRFDSADLDNMVNNGTLESVILHEMLHVIGVGTLWVQKGLRSGTAPTTTPFFTGALARAACIEQHAGAGVCGGGVPVEDCVGITGCGAGTINSHWKELTFRTELMTGYISAPGIPNPFSRMTIQSLADMGYGVNINAEDPYTVPPPSLMSPIPALTIQMPEPHGPLEETDLFGRVTRRFMNRLPPLHH